VTDQRADIILIQNTFQSTRAMVIRMTLSTESIAAAFTAYSCRAKHKVCEHRAGILRKKIGK
jgi:hypothetical protein